MINKCISCKKELEEGQIHVCNDCDYFKEIKIEITFEHHQLDFENFHQTLINFIENKYDIYSLHKIGMKGETFLNLNNVSSIKIKEVTNND